MTPLGVPTPVYNQGGIVGYNAVYGLVGNQPNWDITGIPLLTLDISTAANGNPVPYPLN